MKYKIANKIFSPLQLTGVGIIPARGSVIVDHISKGVRLLEKSGKISISEYKEK